jgi:hypothetical protein
MDDMRHNRHVRCLDIGKRHRQCRHTLRIAHLVFLTYEICSGAIADLEA